MQYLDVSRTPVLEYINAKRPRSFFFEKVRAPKLLLLLPNPSAEIIRPPVLIWCEFNRPSSDIPCWNGLPFA